MKKLFLLVLMLLVIGSTASGTVRQRVVIEDSLLNNQTDPSYTPSFDVGDYSSFIVWFRIAQADTSKDDSVIVTLQTKNDLGLNAPYWEDVLEFAYADAETMTICHVFSYDSISVAKYQVHDAMRFEIDFDDTCTDQDSDTAQFLPIVDTLVNGWHLSTGTDHYALIDETADADSSDYVAVKAYGDVDSLEMFGMEDHYYEESLIDSVVLKFAANSATDTGWLAWAICVNDTANCSWGSDTTDGTAVAGIATTEYTYGLATVPGHGGGWTRAYMDSIVVAFFPVDVNTGGQIRLYYAWVEVFQTAGGQSPTMVYKIKVKGWD